MLRNAGHRGKLAMAGESMGLGALKNVVKSAGAQVDDFLGGGLAYKGAKQIPVSHDFTKKQADAIADNFKDRGKKIMKKRTGVTDAGLRADMKEEALGMFSQASGVKPGKQDIMTDRSLLSKAKEYYTAGDIGGGKGAIAKRVGATAAVGGVGMVGARYASGGTIATNRNGDSDIAGIPFI